MKNIFPKPLLSKEWKATRFVGVLMILFMIFVHNINLIQSLDWLKLLKAENSKQYIDVHYHWLGRILIDQFSNQNAVISVIIAGIIALSLMYSDRKRLSGDFSFSLPFTRLQIYSTKYLAGSVMIVCIHLLTLLSLTVFYFVNREWIDEPYALLPQFSVITMLACILYFSLFMFVHSLIGNSLIAAIAGPLVAYTPYIAARFLADMLAVNIGLAEGSMNVRSLYNSIEYLKLESLTQVHNGYSSIPISYVYTQAFSYTSYHIRFIAAIAIIMLFYLAGLHTFKLNKIENTGKVFIFPETGSIFKLLFIILFGVVLAYIPAGILHNNAAVMDIFLVIGLAVGCILYPKVDRLLS